jgi:sugar phosphate permease
VTDARYCAVTDRLPFALWQNDFCHRGRPRTKAQHRVLILLIFLSVITYLDRVCISVAGPRMQQSLGISVEAWGWVTGVFTIAYALFEIPSGSLGDRIGPRRVLTRIVLWWSAFTSLTGVASNYYLLLGTRFAFGMGEAGAYPNAGIAIARWFPVHRRSGAWGIVLMAAQVGGALAPFLVVPIQLRYGWRASFYLFGILGVFWAAAWYRWFRDTPAEILGIDRAEPAGLPAPAKREHQPLPWSHAIRSSNFWALLVMAGFAGYTLYFFQSWLGTYLVNARGFTETGLMLSSLPFVVGAIANFSGGLLGDWLVKRRGLKASRRIVGFLGYGGAALAIAGTLATQHPYWSLFFLSLTYGGLTFGQPPLMGICLDMGGRHGGAITGAMNTASYTAAFLSSVAFGYIVKATGSYDAPFYPMLVFMTISALLWLKVDATQEVAPEPSPTVHALRQAA